MLLDKFGSQRVAAIRFPVPFGPKSINERRRFLSPIYKLIRIEQILDLIKGWPTFYVSGSGIGKTPGTLPTIVTS
jgi:hypothetical protein